MLLSGIEKKEKAKQATEAHSTSAAAQGWGGTVGLGAGGCSTFRLPLSHACTHTPRQKSFCYFCFGFESLFIKKKKKKKQIKIFPIGGYFFFRLLKIFITQISPIPTCQRKDVLALCKTNSGERLENKSPPSFPPFPGPE